MTESERDAACQKWCAGQDYGRGSEAGKPHPLTHEFPTQEVLAALQGIATKVTPGLEVAASCGHPGMFCVIRRLPGLKRRACVVKRDFDAPLADLFERVREAAERVKASDEPFDSIN